MEVFSICTVQYGSHQRSVAIEQFICDWYDYGTELSVLFTHVTRGCKLNENRNHVCCSSLYPVPSSTDIC